MPKASHSIPARAPNVHPKGKIVLVCGSRSFPHREAVFAMLNALNDFERIGQIVQGGADGADQWAREWADDMGVECLTYPADWEQFGQAAGPIRNAHMLKHSHPNLVLAFPGGTGTADMVNRAKRAGYPVVDVKMRPSDGEDDGTLTFDANGTVPLPAPKEEQ